MTRCAPPYTFFTSNEEKKKKLNSISYFTGINFERNVQNKTATSTIQAATANTIAERERERERAVRINQKR